MKSSFKNLSPSQEQQRGEVNGDRESNDEPQSADPQTAPLKANFYPPWAPRFWNGMRCSELLKLLAEGRFRFSPSRIPSLVPISTCAIGGSVFTAVKEIIYGKKIRQTELEGPPLFIVGHWRTGTTLLHELMGLDSRFTFPTTFECFTPHHFLVSRFFLYHLVKLLIPSRRPMDNMALDVDLPQECDFALAALSAPTPYRRIAFPNQVNSHIDMLSTTHLDEPTLNELRECLTSFYKTLTFRNPNRLVLKSPPHTGRIEKLNEWFPDSQFVHLSRHPYSVVPSTMHLWKSLDYLHGFQSPKYNDEQLLEFVLDSFEFMYEAYFEQRKSIPDSQLYEIRFEDFIQDPVAATELIYRRFELPDFSQVKSSIKASVENRHSHRMNPKKCDRSMQQAIDSRLKNYMQEFGYTPDKVTDKTVTVG